MNLHYQGSWMNIYVLKGNFKVPAKKKKEEKAGKFDCSPGVWSSWLKKCQYFFQPNTFHCSISHCGIHRLHDSQQECTPFMPLWQPEGELTLEMSSFSQVLATNRNHNKQQKIWNQPVPSSTCGTVRENVENNLDTWHCPAKLNMSLDWRQAS